MYTINVEVIRGTRVTHTDNTDRILFLVQEWIKQPKTRSIRVTNADGRTVFSWQRYLHT